MPNMKKTLHHKTNREFFYQEENFKTILNSALDGFYLVNMEGQILGIISKTWGRKSVQERVNFEPCWKR